MTLYSSKNNSSILKRSCALFLALFTLFAAALPVFAEGEEGKEEVAPYAVPELEHAPFVYVYNFENDTVLYEKGDMTVPVYPTSTVKIMAGITAIEALGEEGRSRSITVTQEMLNKASGNKIGFQAGEVVTAEQMLYSMLVNGANDAAIILSYAVAGSVDAFVEMMNDKAFEIGARSTVYANPTGMHSDSMRTTTADTVTIAKYAYENSYFMEIVGTQMYLMEETNVSGFRKIYNRNCLMSKYYRPDYYYENVIGMNAGSTVQGGYSAVAVARSDDGALTYLCVIMGAESVKSEVAGEDDILTNYKGAVDMFNWAFRSFGYTEVLSTKNVVCEVPVGLSSTTDYVTLVPAENVSVFLPTNIDKKSEIKITSTTNENVKAPVSKGQKLGSAKVMYGEVEIGRMDLVSTSDVSRSEFLFALERISEFTKSRFFIATAVSAVVLSVLYVLVKARASQRRLRSRVPRQYRRGR